MQYAINPRHFATLNITGDFFEPKEFGDYPLTPRNRKI